MADMNEFLKRLQARNEAATFSDKLLGVSVARRIQQLIKKDLTREDLLELLYLLTSDELKLANLDPYDRYLLGKYFTWVRDLVKLGEFIYDFMEKEQINDKELKETLNEIQNMVLHDIKFSVDIYLYLMRSTLGVGAFAFDSLSKARYEYEYGGNITEIKPPNEKRFTLFKR